MKELSDTQFRQKFTFTLDEVSKNNYPVIINRESSQPVVILSLKAYRAIESLIEYPSHFMSFNRKEVYAILNVGIFVL